MRIIKQSVPNKPLSPLHFLSLRQRGKTSPEKTDCDYELRSRCRAILGFDALDTSSPLQTPASAVDWRRGEEAEGSRTLPRSFLPCPCMHTATTPACSALLSPTARSIDAHTYSSTAVLCCCNSDATPPPILARSSGIMHALHSHHSAAAIWDAIQARRPDQTRPCMHPSQLAPACILDAFWIPH